MNQPTQPTEDRDTRPDTSQQRPVRVAALLNAVPMLSAAVLVAALAGPKTPPWQGD